MSFKSIIEIAAERAVVEVPKKFIEQYRQEPALLKFQVGENLSNEQKEKIEGLSGDYRYSFIVTTEKEDIWSGFPRAKILKELQNYKNLKVEIWQGNSEEDKRKFRESMW